MKYKFEFMQEEYVPKEYLERDLDRRKRNVMDEIVKTILKHYHWKTRKSLDGKDIHGIEILVCSPQKFNEAMDRLAALTPLFPDIKHIVKEVLDEMFYPETE